MVKVPFSSLCVAALILAGCSSYQGERQESAVSGVVVNGETGEPVAGASVAVYTYVGAPEKPVERQPVVADVMTDDNGAFTVPFTGNYPVTLVVYKLNDSGRIEVCENQKDNVTVELATFYPPPYLNDPTSSELCAGF